MNKSIKLFGTKIGLILAVLFFSLMSCSGGKSNILTPKAYHDAISVTNIQLIDVRTPEEFSEGHIEHALNINYLGDTFLEDISKLDKSKPVYIYCRSGNRSGKSFTEFEKLGFTTIYDLDGGILNWMSEGFKIRN